MGMKINISWVKEIKNLDEERFITARMAHAEKKSDDGHQHLKKSVSTRSQNLDYLVNTNLFFDDMDSLKP